MEAIAKIESEAVKIAEFLEEHKCSGTVVLDVRPMCGWTSFFVITTVRSQAHLQALVGNLDQYLREISVFSLHGKRARHEKGWALIDCGELIVHLMEKEQREFYELERLWFRSPVIYQSSKSS